MNELVDPVKGFWSNFVANMNFLQKHNLANKTISVAAVPRQHDGVTFVINQIKFPNKINSFKPMNTTSNRL